MTLIMSKMSHFTLAAVYLSFLVSPALTAPSAPKVLKSNFKSYIDHNAVKAKSLRKAAKITADTDPSTITNNAILKVVAPVQAGNGQTFENVLVDTGSGVLWLGKEQPYVPGPDSRPMNAEWSIAYSTGDFAGGPAYWDKVTIGQATVNTQIVGAVNASSDFAMVSPLDGILGLGPPGTNDGQISGYNATPTFVEALYKEGVIDEAVFGIYVNGLDPESGDQIGQGEITFGGVDESKFKGEVHWVPQHQDTAQWRWMFDVSSLSFGDLQLRNTTTSATTDTGNLALGIPFDSFFEILNSIPGSTIELTDLSIFLAFPSSTSVESLPNLIIGIGSGKFDIPPSQYLVPKGLYEKLGLTGDYLYSWISPGGQGSCMLGQKFLEAIYTAYDLTGQRVGFAQVI